MKGNVSIIGAGAFGTSIANLISNNGYNVSLLVHESELINQINVEHENKLYFPGFKLNQNIIATQDLNDNIKDVKVIFIAVPVIYLKNILENLKKVININNNFLIVSLSKGLDSNNFLLPTQIIEQELKDKILKENIMALAGPNFAHEIAQEKLTYTTLVGCDQKNLIYIKNILENNYFKCELSSDILGVQIGGAFKNLISLLAGLLYGYGLGQNAVAYFVAKAFIELSSLSKKMGANSETIYDISGFGDLYLSSTSVCGRNYSLGTQIGQLIKNKNFDNNTFFKDKILPEGINTCIALENYSNKNNIKLSYLNIAHNIIFKGELCV
ncbi:MAG: Glycerol-3-phosphate dehydrogenase [NAD(P)+] [candidate division TM6 bacterium GW2011_GWF2_28_16]|nr:MAG: Glycerol-3-phosphate dehydrogenase [NAD(P)+] [candidate division TM6 bacterium GW2011_GWF2_28_16]